MRKLLLAVACCATIGLASARADVTYRYVTDKASYTGAVGAKVPVQIFLQETVTAPSTSLIFSQGGLFGGAFLVNSPGGAIFGTTTSGTPDFKIAGNAALGPAGFGVGSPPAATQLDQTPFGPNQSGLIINTDIGPNDGPKFTSGTPAVRQILLGTVNVTVPATSTTLTVTPYTGSANTITQTGTDLDFGTQAINGYTGAGSALVPTWAFTVSSAVIPEPSSMALCGLLASGMSYLRLRRRKAIGAEPLSIA